MRNKRIEELEMIARAIVGEREIERAMIIPDEKEPDVVGISCWALNLLAHGYKVLFKKKLWKDVTLIVFTDPSNEYFIPTIVENPIMLNLGRFKHYKLYDKRKGMTFKKKLLKILKTKLDLVWKCGRCGRKQVMTLEDVLRRKKCYDCQLYHHERYGQGIWLFVKEEKEAER